MSNEPSEQKPARSKVVESATTSSHHVGLDVGTMNLVSARVGKADDVDITSLRNVYLAIDDEETGEIDLSDLSHVRFDDKTFILSHDAYNISNIFGHTARRSMQNGLVSPDDIYANDILGVMIKELIHTGTPKAKCVYSVPAPPLEGAVSTIYHESILGRIIADLGYVAEPINEALAIVYSECATSNFSGVAISFGAGLTNVAVVYKSIPVLTFSVDRGGDWIDKNVAAAIGTIANRVTFVKERRFDIKNFNDGRKKERRIKEALAYYYTHLIHHVIQHIAWEFDRHDMDITISNDIPLIIAGGTAMAGGFLNVIKQEMDAVEWPLDISEIRMAADPLSCVAQGCLIQALKNFK